HTYKGDIMNTKLLAIIYLILLSFSIVYFPDYSSALIQYNETFLSILKNSSTATITSGS
ncbi:TPA_asm: hypothetical protein, partial [ssRNA phage SRR5467091_3]